MMPSIWENKIDVVQNSDTVEPGMCAMKKLSTFIMHTPVHMYFFPPSMTWQISTIWKTCDPWIDFPLATEAKPIYKSLYPYDHG